MRVWMPLRVPLSLTKAQLPLITTRAAKSGHFSAEKALTDGVNKRMNRPPPLSLRARAPWKSQEVKFRGTSGDFTDRRYLAEQYRDALKQYRAAETDLFEAKQNISESSKTLDRKSQVRIHLFQFTGRDTGLIEEEESLRRELAEVEQEVADTQRLWETIRKRTSPMNLGNLRNELFELQLELQKQEAEIELSFRRIRDTTERTAAAQISAKFENALKLEQKLARGKKRKGRLRQAIDKSMFALELRSAPAITDTDEVVGLRTAMRGRLEAEVGKTRAKEKLQRRRDKHYNEIALLIERIETLNKRMDELGMEGDAVDTKPLREKYLVRREASSSSCEYEEEEPEPPQPAAKDSPKTEDAKKKDSPKTEDAKKSKVKEGDKEKKEKEQSPRDASPARKSRSSPPKSGDAKQKRSSHEKEGKQATPRKRKTSP